MKTYFIVPIMLIVALATTLAYADNDKKHGLTYGELSVKWQQWALAGPKGANAVEDETGDFVPHINPKTIYGFLQVASEKQVLSVSVPFRQSGLCFILLLKAVGSTALVAQTKVYPMPMYETSLRQESQGMEPLCLPAPWTE